MMKTNRQLPTSKHFRLEQLAEGVYAVIHIGGGEALSNAGIIDLGDRSVVYDALLAPQAAEDLRAIAETVTGHPIDAVIDSHWHYDHIWGNQAFSADTDIISTDETRRLIIATKGHGAFDEFLANAEANLESTRAALQVAEDERERRQLSTWTDYHQSVVDTRPILQIRPPNLTFSGRLTLHGTARSAELIDFANGHTESDIVLFLPEEGIAFMSDLLFIDYQPYLGGGDPDSLLRILAKVADLSPRLLVPGHGPVGTADSLAMMGNYVHALDGLARQMVADGQGEEVIATIAQPEPFGDWLFGSFFPGNVQFLYQRCLRESAKRAAPL